MAEDKGLGNGRKDYTEIEFELGDLEFEAKGKAVVVERLFTLLLDKIESGVIVPHPYYEEEEDEEEKDEEISPEFFDSEEDEFEEESVPETGTHVDPPPQWDMLDSESPRESDVERAARDPE